MGLHRISMSWVTLRHSYLATATTEIGCGARMVECGTPGCDIAALKRRWRDREPIQASFRDTDYHSATVTRVLRSVPQAPKRPAVSSYLDGRVPGSVTQALQIHSQEPLRPGSARSLDASRASLRPL